uniref:Uncharacterized protein n=1 Tax=Arundo donax TaxID=35708 RepID=A0A0A9HMQ9_ARUDO
MSMFLFKKFKFHVVPLNFIHVPVVSGCAIDSYIHVPVSKCWPHLLGFTGKC